jgi:hypothetical protein
MVQSSCFLTQVDRVLNPVPGQESAFARKFGGSFPWIIGSSTGAIALSTLDEDAKKKKKKKPSRLRGVSAI